MLYLLSYTGKGVRTPRRGAALDHYVTISPLPCIVCGKTLDPALPGSNSLMQPSEAVWFSAYGQYGSTVFDPQDGSQIRVNVCDSCLLERKDRVWHTKFVDQRPLLVFSEPWEPGQQAG